MSEAKAAPVLEVRLKNSQPVELVDLTNSLTALSKAYESFVYSSGYDPQAGNVKLYIRRLRGGSIVAELVAMAQQASFILDHLDTFAGFVTHVDDLTRYFLGHRRSEDTQIAPTKIEAEQLNQILEPVAKDNGAQLFLNVSGDAKIDVHYYLNSQRANAAQNAIKRFLGDTPPITGIFQDQVLYLAQVRGDPRSKAGDFGIIERFSDKPVKLRFASEDVKTRILEVAHPFDVAFIVDCEVSTVGDKPALYKIYTVKDHMGRPK